MNTKFRWHYISVWSIMPNKHVQKAILQQSPSFNSRFSGPTVLETNNQCLVCSCDKTDKYVQIDRY